MLLPWRDGRCVQGPKAFTVACWSTITNDSAFMQGELQPAIRTKVIFKRFTPIHIFVTLCNYHCNTWVAQPIRAMTTWPHPLLMNNNLRNHSIIAKSFLILLNQKLNNIIISKSY